MHVQNWKQTLDQHDRICIAPYYGNLERFATWFLRMFRRRAKPGFDISSACKIANSNSGIRAGCAPR